MKKRICRAGEFRELLGKRALVADGAMGTMLYSKGVFINRCYDELNLSAARAGRRDPPGVRARPAPRSSKPTPSAPTARAWPLSASPKS